MKTKKKTPKKLETGTSTSKVYLTKPEAQAFAEGVEYVNDSALEVVGIKRAKKGWVVVLVDADKDEEE